VRTPPTRIRYYRVNETNRIDHPRFHRNHTIPETGNCDPDACGQNTRFEKPLGNVQCRRNVYERQKTPESYKTFNRRNKNYERETTINKTNEIFLLKKKKKKL